MATACGMPIATSPAVIAASATPTLPGTGMSPENSATSVFTRMSEAKLAE